MRGWGAEHLGRGRRPPCSTWPQSAPQSSRATTTATATTAKTGSPTRGSRSPRCGREGGGAVTATAAGWRGDHCHRGCGAYAGAQAGGCVAWRGCHAPCPLPPAPCPMPPCPPAPLLPCSPAPLSPLLRSSVPGEMQAWDAQVSGSDAMFQFLPTPRRRVQRVCAG